MLNTVYEINELSEKGNNTSIWNTSYCLAIPQWSLALTQLTHKSLLY